MWNENTLTHSETPTLSVTPTHPQEHLPLFPGPFRLTVGMAGVLLLGDALRYLLLCLLRLCLGQGSDIWAYVVQYVRNQR